MTVILVLSTFIMFLLIDHFFSKKPALQIAVQPAVAREIVAPLQPSLVGGFKVPDNLRYHPGHTWALSESPSLVRVGVDDFASKLMGKVERLSLPQRGQWIRQGQKLASVYRDGAKVDMLSPIEGPRTPGSGRPTTLRSGPGDPIRQRAGRTRSSSTAPATG